MLGMLFDQRVDLAHPIRRHPKQIICKPAHLGACGAVLGPERPPYLVCILLSHVRLEKHLQCDFAGFSSSTQLAVSDQPSAIRATASSVYMEVIPVRDRYRIPSEGGESPVTTAKVWSYAICDESAFQRGFWFR